MNRSQRFTPFVEELPRGLQPVEAFQRLAGEGGVIFLDSASTDAELGKYSFVACDPFQVVKLAHDSPVLDATHPSVEDGFTKLRAALAPFAAETLAELPPFQGGAAGLFGYDLSRRLERIGAARFDEFRTPPMVVGLYDVVVAFDHRQQRGWVISQGFPEQNPVRRGNRAAARGRRMLERLSNDGSPTYRATAAADSIACAQLAPQYPTTRMSDVSSNFSRDGYLRAVERVVEYIHAGDIFQANLSQRLLKPASCSPVDLYLRLRERNPASFAAFFDMGAFQLVSASPERLVRVRDRQVEARPIKGTRSRRHRPEADLYSQDDLLLSDKDRAENVMIVDLLRNDLSKYCQADSVAVTQLCAVETFQYVHHLVSAVVGRLREGATSLDLLRGAFPGGSITGAPKVRAMEIIAKQEPTARGPYCGSLGYLGFDGALDTNILIRTITAGRGWWQVPVGGGIVADSDPNEEYEETWHKAEGMLRAFEP
ncbi:MAG: aminodeoxychorismate synthase component I [Pirellulales bacterium]